MCNGLKRVLFEIVKRVKTGEQIKIKKKDIERHVLKPLIRMGDLNSSQIIAEKCLNRDLTDQERDKIEDARIKKEEESNDFFKAIEILARTN